MQRFIACQVVRVGRAETWRSAWKRTWIGWQPLDLEPFYNGFMALLWAGDGVLWLLDGKPNYLAFVGFEVLAVVFGLVWLLWEPPWMRGRGPYMPFGYREAMFWARHPVLKASVSTIVFIGLLGLSCRLVIRSWPLAAHPLPTVVAGGTIGVGLAALSMHALLVRRWRIGRTETWFVRHLWLTLPAIVLLLLNGASTVSLIGGSAAIPLLSADVVIWVGRAVRQVRDPVATDSDLAQEARVLGNTLRVSTLPVPWPGGMSGHAAAKASEHWPPHPADRTPNAEPPKEPPVQLSPAVPRDGD